MFDWLDDYEKRKRVIAKNEKKERIEKDRKTLEKISNDAKEKHIGQVQEKIKFHEKSLEELRKTLKSLIGYS